MKLFVFKSWTAILVAIFAIAFTANRAIAQPITGCEDPCDNVQWDVYTVPFPSYTNGAIKIKVTAQRKECPPNSGNWFVDILEINAEKGMDPFPIDLYGMQREIMEAMFHLFDNLIPAPLQIQAQIRVPACWHYADTTYTDMGTIIPCDNEPCCTVNYTYNLNDDELTNEQWKYTIDGVGVDLYHEGCAEEAEFPCLNICNALHLNWDNPTYPEREFELCDYGVSTWNGPFFTRCFESNDTLDAWHLYRDGPNGKEIHILEINMRDGSGYSDDFILNKAIRKILSKQHLMFGMTSNIVKLSLRACWSRLDINGFTRIMPCETSTECCYAFYEIGFNSYTLENEVKDYWFDDPNGACNSCPPVGDPGCNICYCNNDQALGIPPSTILPKLSEIDGEDNNNLAVATVRPNPTNGNTELVVNNSETGSVTLIISDMLGNRVFKADAKKQSQEFIFTFDAKNYSNGIYYYTVVLNGTPLNSGKFIVIK